MTPHDEKKPGAIGKTIQIERAELNGAFIGPP